MSYALKSCKQYAYDKDMGDNRQNAVNTGSDAASREEENSGRRNFNCLGQFSFAAYAAS